MADEWRISWTGIEVFQKPELYQVNANNAEVLSDAYTSLVSINGNSVEVLHDGTWVVGTHRVSWTGIEAFLSNTSPVHVTWTGIEAFLSNTSPARVTWTGIEAFVQYAAAAVTDDSSITVFW